MKQIRNTKLFVIIGAVILASGCVSSGKYKKIQGLSTDYQDKLGEAENRIEQLTEEKNTLEANVANLQKEKDHILSSNKVELEKLRENFDKEQQAKLNKVQQDYDELVGGLKEELEQGQVKITQLEGKLTVNIADKIFFNSGKARLNKSGREVLAHLGEVVKSLDKKQVLIEGHTDNTPISVNLKSKFPTNWELSTARATEVVRFLEEKAGIEPHRLVAMGYGSSRPVADNKTKDGRAQNRRIEIVFQDVDWKKVAPLLNQETKVLKESIPKTD